MLMQEDVAHKNNKTLIINKSDLGIIYPKIGQGDESVVYNYKNRYALKIFQLFYETENWEKLNAKCEKVASMTNLKDKDFCFPLGMIKEFDSNIKGCFMDYIDCKDNGRDFHYLYKLNNMKDIINYLYKMDDAIRRIHRKDVRLGDIKEDNILITKDNEIKFIDTDNYAYEDYDFDVAAWRVRFIREKYGNYLSYQDTDILLTSMMALKYILKDPYCCCESSPEYFHQKINELNITKEGKNALLWIFSDSCERPYISEILPEIKLEDKPKVQVKLL